MNRSKKSSPLILISNDDGIQAPGIRVLARALKKIRGARVVVVAPDREKSAASHALTLHRPLRVEKISRDTYSVDGTPTDAVMLAVHTILKKKPDLIISGINRGANLGEDVHYSGTVSAALEGAIMGIPAIAVSVVGLAHFRYDVAARFSVKLVRKVLRDGLPVGVVLNVNVPSVHSRKIRGTVATSLGKHNYGDVNVEKIDPRGRPYYWIGGTPLQFAKRAGSDCEAYLQRKISVTPIQVDMTDQIFLRKLKKWKLD
ncbi:MAG: 5'/3'-nucleotidase SurE [Deltaproteobacteria bacterium]|nr:5'/3'-nucleotidase SurE [Deltaproteobacteria bacterium]